ncbi:hypothetical protein F4809DRAFT_610148 [Biscogniauxia mediterranea]|nr:hypothetical protein F4809DRAFT_610148 [Biscogniauxia mediterranea]
MHTYTGAMAAMVAAARGGFFFFFFSYCCCYCYCRCCCRCSGAGLKGITLSKQKCLGDVDSTGAGKRYMGRISTYLIHMTYIPRI